MVTMVDKPSTIEFSKPGNSIIIYVKIAGPKYHFGDSNTSEIAEWVQLRSQGNLDDQLSQPYPKATR